MFFYQKLLLLLPVLNYHSSITVFQEKLPTPRVITLFQEKLPTLRVITLFQEELPTLRITLRIEETSTLRVTLFQDRPKPGNQKRLVKQLWNVLLRTDVLSAGCLLLESGIEAFR